MTLQQPACAPADIPRRATFDDLQQAPSPRTLRALCAAMATGGQPTTARRLGGGLASGMHRFDIVGPEGDRRRLVVRRYSAEHLAAAPQAPDQEWQTLTFLARTPVAAPRPVWLDAAGELFGVPALVMTRLAGRPLLAPRDVRSWAKQLGTILAAIHACPSAAQDLVLLPRLRQKEIARRLDAPVEAPQVASRLAAHPVAAALWKALRRWWTRLPAEEPVLLHGDYWTGNTLWSGGRLSGVVDWGHAALGARGRDLASCRIDLVQLAGPAAADLFLRAYEEAVGHSQPYIFVWDLWQAWNSLPVWHLWPGPFAALGRPDLTLPVITARLEAHIAAALDQARRSPS